MERFLRTSPRAYAVLAAVLLMLAAAFSAVAAEAPYRLGPGDLLQISVWGHEELRATVEVRPDGYVTFPLAGDVEASGRTPAEVSRVIASRLETFVRSPQVTVIVQQFRTIRAQALGAVRQPGTYPLRPAAPITDLLGAAGGLLDDADVQRAVLTRQPPGQAARSLPLDLKAVLEGAASVTELRLEDGDVLFVPRAEPALALGEVRQPGAYLVRPGMRVVDLVGAAGGLTDRAAAEAATLTRRLPTAGSSQAGRTEAIPLDLSALIGAAFAGGAPQVLPAAASVEVRPGDVLLIPRAEREVAVLGQVQRPGVVPYRTGMTLAQALAAVGGVTQEADLARAALTRTEADGSQRIIPVDLRPVVELRSVKADQGPALMPGDMLVVPRAERTLMVLGEVRQPGVVRYRTGMTVAEALAEAGGPTELADLARASVTRVSTEETTAPAEPARRIEVDLSSLAGGWAPSVDAASAMTAAAVAVQPGDIVLIPRAERQVVVLGAVRQPGSYPLRPGARVLDALAAAGGLTEEADGEAITLVRPERGGSPADTPAGAGGSEAGRPLSYEAMLRATGDPSVNPPVLPGDVVVVARTDRRVLALGAVASPGAFRYREGLKVLDLVAQAGGPRPDADASTAVLTRPDGKTLHLDLHALVKSPGSPENVALKPGDVLYVPPSRQVLVLGEVGRPGAYTVPQGGRVLDMLALAGGVRPDAGVTTVVLTRRAGEADAATGAVFRLDYPRLVSGADASLNMRVENGDVIYVPEGRRHVLVLGQVQRPGLYVLPSSGPVRLLDVLALAGGPTRRAVLDSVGILRVDGRAEQAAAGRGATLFQGRASENPVIQPGDVVYVPETRWPDWSQILGVLQGIRLFQEIVQGL